MQRLLAPEQRHREAGDDQAGHRDEDALPAERAARREQEAAAGEHPDLVADDLRNVALSELAWLEDVDINGDGTNDDLLPGTTVNAFGRSLDEDELRQLVDSYNQQLAGRPLCCGQTAPRVTLPASYDFYDNFFTQDVRLTHTVPLGPSGARLTLFGEVFNLFNTANLVNYSGNLLDPVGFGQPAGRVTQVFGSGGPRTFQIGMRLNF